MVCEVQDASAARIAGLLAEQALIRAEINRLLADPTCGDARVSDLQRLLNDIEEVLNQ